MGSGVMSPVCGRPASTDSDVDRRVRGIANAATAPTADEDRPDEDRRDDAVDEGLRAGIRAGPREDRGEDRDAEHAAELADRVAGSGRLAFLLRPDRAEQHVRDRCEEEAHADARDR